MIFNDDTLEVISPYSTCRYFHHLSWPNQAILHSLWCHRNVRSYCNGSESEGNLMVGWLWRSKLWTWRFLFRHGGSYFVTRCQFSSRSHHKSWSCRLGRMITVGIQGSKYAAAAATRTHGAFCGGALCLVRFCRDWEWSIDLPFSNST